MDHTINNDASASPLGTQEAQYQLAIRLVDYMRLGEAIRILEALGDYKNSPALLKEALAIKAYSDEEEEKRKEEERRSRQRRAEEKRAADKKWRNRLLACAAIAAVAILIAITRS